jgi:uncharacterized protein YndB with AHSA1/START domain
MADLFEKNSSLAPRNRIGSEGGRNAALARRPLHACEADVRVGGRYRFEFGREASKPMMGFFGKYIEVIPHSRLVWTNEESDEGSVTTVTFEEKDGRTLLVMHELYPSKEALDGTLAGMEGGMPESFAQLDELLVTLGA